MTNDIGVSWSPICINKLRTQLSTLCWNWITRRLSVSGLLVLFCFVLFCFVFFLLFCVICLFVFCLLCFSFYLNLLITCQNKARLANIKHHNSNWFIRITASSIIKILGVTIDIVLTITEHFTLCKSINFSPLQIWFIFHNDTFSALRAFASSKLDYANALLSGAEIKISLTKCGGSYDFPDFTSFFHNPQVIILTLD